MSIKFSGKSLRLGALAAALLASSIFDGAVQLTAPTVYPERFGDTRGADASAAIMAAFDYASSLYDASTGVRAFVKLEPRAYNISGLMLPVGGNVIIDQRGTKFVKSANGSSVGTNSMLRTQDVATALTGSAAYTLTLTAAPATGATTATLTTAWTGSSGAPPVLFANGDCRNVVLTNGSTAVSWYSGLSANAGLTTTLTGATYYGGRYANITILGGTYDPNGYLCPAQIVRLQNMQDLEVKGTRVNHWVRLLTFTAAFTGGETGGTLNTPWAGPSNTYANSKFSNGDVRVVSVTNGSTAVTWTGGGLSGAATTVNVAVNSWAFQIGGRSVRTKDLKVIGGTQLYQDGLHFTSGDDIQNDGGYFEAGDDPLAFGVDSAGIESWDDEALTNVVVRSPVLKATRGNLKAYYGINTATGMPFAGAKRGRIDGVTVLSPTGSLGATANGGIYIVDTQSATFDATPGAAATSANLVNNYTGTTGVYTIQFASGSLRDATFTNGSKAVTWTGGLSASATSPTVTCGDPDRIKNFKVLDFDLTCGSAVNDGLNSAGFLIAYATTVTLRGTLRIIDTASGSGFAAGDALCVRGADISLRIPAMPRRAGLQWKESSDINVHDGHYDGGAGTGRASVEQTGTTNLLLQGNTFANIPSNGAALLVQGVGSGIRANTYRVLHNNATKAASATITRFLGHQSAGAGFVTFALVDGNDTRGQNNSSSIDQPWNSTGFNPDMLIVGKNRLGLGGTTMNWAVTYSATPAIPAAHGVVITLTLTGNAAPTMPSTAGMEVGFRLRIKLTQDATGGRTVTWPAGCKFPVAAWVDATGSDGSKFTFADFEFDGTNFNQVAPNRWV